MLMKNRILLIKPASSLCNMRCDYCFYNDEAENREIACYGVMTRETAHNLIDRTLTDLSGEATFAFQGGEPTCAGFAFFEDFVSYVKEKYPDKKVSYALQTNGYIIDRTWAHFFKENNFLIGLSMDGNKKIHDTYRHGRDGKGSFSHTYKASQFLTAEKVDFNILTTVTNNVVKHIDEIYAFFVRNGFMYQQYIPCIDPLSAARGGNEYSLSASGYGEFLCRLFDLWYKDLQAEKYVSIRYFDNLVNMLLGHYPEACGMMGICGNNYVVEADGAVYPCDFYVLDGYKLGNINTDDFSVLDEKRKEIGFVEKSFIRSPDCEKCEFYPICRGGCRRDRDNFQTGKIDKTYLCAAYKRFFSYALPRLSTVARFIESQSGRQ
jgi:anaerobic sulfatase-maturating enzyme